MFFLCENVWFFIAGISNENDIENEWKYISNYGSLDTKDSEIHTSGDIIRNISTVAIEDPMYIYL